MSTVGPGGADWDDIYLGDGSDTQPLDRLMLADALTRRPGSALDLGCGGGGDLIGLAKRGWEVTGVDSSPRAIRSAEISAERAGVKARFLQADITVWKPERSYDLVISLFALPPRGPERRAVLALACGSLAPDGLLVVGEWAAIDGDNTYLTVSELTAELRELEITRAELINADPDPSHQIAGRTWPAVLVTAQAPTHPPIDHHLPKVVH